MYKSVIKNKLSELWRDKRPFKLRLILSLLCAAACVFTFIIFGPYEIYIQNMQFLTFPFSALVLPQLLTALLIFCVMTALLLLLRGKVFNYAVSVLFGGTLAGYLQGNFFNIDHGALDGSEISWLEYKWPMLGNCIVWLLIFAVILTVLYCSRRVWANMIKLVCAILIGAQAIALAILLTSTDFTANQEVWISDEGIFEVSSTRNVILFLLDTHDTSFHDRVLEQRPEFWDEFGGFTYYHNFTGSYTGTFPSIAYFLSGVKYDYTYPAGEYLEKAWSEGTMLPDINGKGFDSKLYVQTNHVAGSAKNLAGLIDNIGTADITIDYKQMIKKMLILSVYRYAPEAFKPYFHIYSGDLEGIATVTGDSNYNLYRVNDPNFWSSYREQGITVDHRSKGSFIFYHLDGAHGPFKLDENAEYVEEGTTRDRQITGELKMILDYIEQLKQNGVYDNTTIIITADHGYGDVAPELTGKRLLTLMIKPAGADTNAPMQVSNKQICQDNLRASIVSYFDLNTTKYGRTIESIGEDEQMTRYVWWQTYDEALEHRDKYLITYEISGDGNDFANWKKLSVETIQYPYYK